MSTSTDAIIAYCIPLKNFSVGFAEYSNVNLTEHKEFKEDFEVFNKHLTKKYGCELILHCSDNCNMFVLAIAGTRSLAWRGSPERLENLTVDPTWDSTLENGVKYLTHLSNEQSQAEMFETTSHSGWHIFSYWG